MRSTPPRSYKIAWRHWLVVLGLCVGVAGLVWRMVYLTVVERPFLQAQGNARTLRTLEIPAYRGIITDRNGHPLAVSSPVESVWVNPQEIQLDTPQVAKLAKLLGITTEQLTQRVQDNQDKEFLYVARHVSPEVQTKAAALAVHGVYFQKEYRRFYPQSEATAHVLGFTDLDEQGREGIELAYNEWLQGQPGERVVLKNRLGHVVSVVNDSKPPRPGRDLALSLDHRVQYIAHRELKTAMQENNAASGSIVILNVHTGEVLAMVNQPSYNPNQRQRKPNEHQRNRAMTDLFEPGSTIKPFSLLNVLNTTDHKVTDTVDTAPGWMMLGRYPVRDPNNFGTLDFAGVLRKSSNIGTAKLILDTPPNSLRDFLQKVGFGELTSQDFPGEAEGVVPSPTRWSDFTLATLSFGYSMSSTAIQLARAYASLLNGGYKLPVSLIKLEKPPQGELVHNPATLALLLPMLEDVVSGVGASGRRAQIPEYRVLGKTGTARMVGPNGYYKDKHTSFFVGAVPASNPQLVAVIVINKPSNGQYYGGVIAAPVFARVMGETLRLLDIPPDAAGQTVIDTQADDVVEEV